MRFDHYGMPTGGPGAGDCNDFAPWPEYVETQEDNVSVQLEPEAVKHPQGSEGWITERLGHVTASCFFHAMTGSRTKGEKFGKTAISYMDDLLGEHLTQQPASELKTYAMEWGNRWEPVAREYYRQKTNFDVREVGFIKHPTQRFIGCSPDSLVDHDGAMEIKCPLTASNHVRVLSTGTVPDDHTKQIQGILWVTGREWCDFVTYHDNFPPELRMFVIRVERDDKIISEIEERIIEFRDEMVRRLENLANLWKRQVA